MSTLPPALHVVTPSAMTMARRIVERVVRQLVPSRADFCLVHLVSRGGIKAVAGAHASRDGERLLRMLMRSYRISPGDGASGVGSVIRTRRPLLRTAIQIDAAVAGRGNTRVTELHRRLAPRSALVVPVLTPLGVAGGLTLCYSESGRAYSARDLAAAQHAATTIAQALTTSPAVRLPATPRLARPGTALRRARSRDIDREPRPS